MTVLNGTNESNRSRSLKKTKQRLKGKYTLCRNTRSGKNTKISAGELQKVPSLQHCLAYPLSELLLGTAGDWAGLRTGLLQNVRATRLR
jgi:hypothetical protein